MPAYWHAYATGLAHEIDYAASNNRQSFFNAMRILFVAPCHVIADERVLRTLRAAQAKGCDCFLAVDEQVYVKQVAQANLSAEGSLKLLKSATLLSLPEVSGRKSVARLQRLFKVPAIVSQASMIRPDVVHVHESGVLGLLMAFWFKRKAPELTVYFDYHDWIPYELSVFVGHSRWLYRLLLPALMRVCRLLVAPLDGVIGVSEGQADWVRKKLRAKRVVVVPNVRPVMKVPLFEDVSYEPSLIFVGNVMRSRMLERLIEVLAHPRLVSFAPKFHVFGAFADEAYRVELLRLAESRGLNHAIRFYGSYQSDQEIASALCAGSLAYLFPLTFKSNPSGIEAISSSNKFFSYATLGLPMLVHESYAEMVALLGSYRAGFAFASIDELVEHCAEIWSDPELWFRLSSGSGAIAAAMNNDVYENRLQHLYR